MKINESCVSTDAYSLNPILQSTQYSLSQFFVYCSKSLGILGLLEAGAVEKLVYRLGVAAPLQLFQLRNGYFTPLSLFYSASIYQFTFL